MNSTAIDFFNAATVREPERRLTVKIGTHVKLIEIDKIVYVRADGNYIGIVMAGGETLHTKETLSHLEARLPDRRFLRIHRSLVINRDCVTEIKSHQNSYEFVLMNGIRLLSGTTFRKQLRKEFLAALGRVRDPSAPPAIPQPVEALPDMSFSAAVFSIRQCAPGDEYALAQLGKTTFLQTYHNVFSPTDILVHCASHGTPGIYRQWLEDPRARAWIAETAIGGVPGGYLVLAPPALLVETPAATDLEVRRLYLLKHFQRSGLGKKLMAQAMKYARVVGCRRLLLGDYYKNGLANAFFESLGFRRMGAYLRRIGGHQYQDIILGMEL
ncbi:MAG: GNAT family N-acetyltransferase [Gammaproteobacteria bacterium]